MIARFVRWLLTPPRRKKPLPPPTPTPSEPEKPHYQPPTGREIRGLLAAKAHMNFLLQPMTTIIDKVEYRVIYVFTHSSWYSIAFLINEMKKPAMKCFVRGKKTPDEMKDIIKSELFRKKKAALAKELRKKRLRPKLG